MRLASKCLTHGYFVLALCLLQLLPVTADAQTTTPTVTVSGSELKVCSEWVGSKCGFWLYDSGTVTVVLNGVNFSVSYNRNSTTTSISSSLANSINGSSVGISASVSGSVISLSSGASDVTSLTATSSTSDPGDFGGPSFFPDAAVSGYINPKYKIVGVAYSVPGLQSYVQYTGTTMMGTSTSTSSSFSTNVASSFTICGGAGVEVPGAGGGAIICGTYSNSFTQESDTSSSIAINQTTSYTNKWSPLTGPALDHGNDVIYIWVNPQVWYTIHSNPGPTLNWNGYTYDELDDSNNMEVIPLRLSQLLNPSTIPAYTQGRLLRAWAPNNTDGSGPAITNQDLLNIAAADPFSNPGYTVTIGSDGKTTTDNRFTQTTSAPMFYVPGGNYVYNWGYTTTDTQGKGGKNTYVQGFAIEEKFNSKYFISKLSYDLKQSITFTWTDQWNILTTKMMSQSNTVSITGPTGTYTGPNEFNVYQDNVYGTFMVAPVPPQ